VGDEPGDERHLRFFGRAVVTGGDFESGEDGIGGGEDAGVVVLERGESVGKAGLVLGDGHGGAPDVPAVDGESIEQGDFAGVAGAGSEAGLGFIDCLEAVIDIGEAGCRFAACGEIGLVFDAEGLDTRRGRNDAGRDRSWKGVLSVLGLGFRGVLRG
jgi:hypothetical protein